MKGGSAASEFPYVWRIRKWHPERYGTRCAVTARGKLNSCRVEWPDGYWTITSRNFIRKAP